MLDYVMMLAQTAPEGQRSPMEVVDGAVARLDILNHPNELLAALGNVHIVWASVITVVGALCVLNGYKWHKWVVVICAFLGGLGLGRLLSLQMGESPIVIGAIGLLCAIAATPLLRFAVAIFGGLTGAFLGAHIWTAVSQSPDAAMAGAGMGFIGLGMLTFIMFRVVIVLFTSIGGAAMGVLGILALLMHVPTLEGSIRTSLTEHNMVLPLLVAVGAVTGLVLQQSEIRGARPEEAEAE